MEVEQVQKRHSVRKGLRRCLLALMICIFQSSTVHATDLLVIEEIELKKPAGGLDNSLRVVVEQMGAIAAILSVDAIKGKVSRGLDGAGGPGSNLSDLVEFENIENTDDLGDFLPALDPEKLLEEYNNLTDEERKDLFIKRADQLLGLDYEETKQIADAGSAAAKAVLDFVDDTYSGQDDLIVTVNGETVIPAAGSFQPISAGQKINTNTRISFDRGVRVRFIEHDSGSDNDDLGVFEFNSDEQLNLDPYAVFRGTAIVLAPNPEDGSVYLMKWRVERNRGDSSKVVKNMICGTNQCNACFNNACIGQKISDLDRDGDLPDLLACPFPLKVTGFQRFDQIWPFDDVYLRVCGSTCPSISTPVINNIGVAQNNKPFFKWTSVANAKKYQIFEKFEDNDDADPDRVGFLKPTWLSYAQVREREPGTYHYRVRGVTVDETCTGDFSEAITLIVPEVPVSLTVVTASEDIFQRGTGSVTANLEPISTIGGNFYTPGDVVVLSAVPTARSEFVGWSGDSNVSLCGAQISCSIAINRGDGLNVQALFRPKPSLKFAPIGQGTVSINPVGLACNFVDCFNYFTGTAVSLTANTGELSDFIGWTGDDICASNGETLNVTLNSDTTCRAKFKRNHYTLDLTVAEGSQVSSVPASFDCGDICQEAYPVNRGAQTVMLNAVIDPGFIFVRWAGDFDCWDEDEADNNPLSISVSVGEKDVECSIVVVPADTEFALTIEKLGGGAVKALAEPVIDSSGIDCTLKACSQDYPVNTQVQLSAKASPGSEFVGFESPDVGSDGYVPENDDCIDGQINMIENISCVALFKTNILVVDGTDSGLNKEQNPYIGPMNNQELVDFKIWDVYNPSSGDNSTDPDTLEKRIEPVAEDLAEFGRVIWYTGNASSQASLSRAAGPSAAAEASLAEYLDNSGCLMMSSPEYVKDRGLTPFMQTYFGLSEVTEDVFEEYVEGAGDPGFGFNELTLDSFKDTGSEGYFGITDGTNGQFLSDSLLRDREVLGSEVLFTYRESGDEAAVGLDNGIFRSVYFGFPFLGIGSGTRQNNTLGAFLDFCGQPEADDLFEVNDDFDSAVERSGPVDLNRLKILTGNDDYFKWTSDWFADTSIRITYTQSRGDLSVEVYDSNSVLLASSDSQDGADQILIEDVDSGQTFFVRIFGVDEAEGTYSLEISPSGPIDRDHDGVADEDDALPEDASEQSDADGDLIGDKADLDDDNDGLPDTYELLNGFDPLVENPITNDTDQDTFTDIQEFFAETDPRDAASFPPPLAIPITVVTNSVVKADNDGDGKADILWRNSVDGRNYLWTMNGRSIIKSAGLTAIADLRWQIVGRGDFDGDGQSDIVWRNSNTGRNYVWLMNGFSIKQQGELNYVTDSNWRIKQVTDLDGDGKDDIVWHHAIRGDTWIYLMNGIKFKTSQASLKVSDLNWEIVASGDVNGDGKGDIIWRHKTRGDNYIWLMNGTTTTSRYVLNSVNTSWIIAGAGDINGDGTDDIIWRNQNDGRNWAYLMSNGQIQTSSLINAVSNIDWQIADISDLNGDGKADLFWRQGQSGESYIYLMNGVSINSRGLSNKVNPQWQVIH